MSDLSIKRMMTFLTAICILVTCVICFGATAGICEEINQTQEGSSHTWRDHHHDIHHNHQHSFTCIMFRLIVSCFLVDPGIPAPGWDAGVIDEG